MQDISVFDLIREELLDDDAIGFCFERNISSLNEINQFFIDKPECTAPGQGFGVVMVNLRAVLTDYFLKTPSLDICFEVLKVVEQIDMRAVHICIDNGPSTLEKLQEFNRRHGGFMSLRNCGLKSSLKLREVCAKYEYLYGYSQLVDSQKLGAEYGEISSLRLDIDLYSLVCKESLSVRSYNICRSAGLTSLVQILKHYYSGDSFKKFRNCGKASKIELIGLCERYKYLLYEPLNDDESLLSAYELSIAKIKLELQLLRISES